MGEQSKPYAAKAKPNTATKTGLVNRINYLSNTLKIQELNSILIRSKLGRRPLQLRGIISLLIWRIKHDNISLVLRGESDFDH